jgi:hypothetical protein
MIYDVSIIVIPAVLSANEHRAPKQLSSSFAESQSASLPYEGRSRQIASSEPRFAMGEVSIEDFVAQANFGCARQTSQEPIVRVLVREGKCPLVNLTFDHFKALSGTTKVGF